MSHNSRVSCSEAGQWGGHLPGNRLPRLSGEGMVEFLDTGRQTAALPFCWLMPETHLSQREVGPPAVPGLC